MNRLKTLERLQSNQAVDVLIIGGGINGLGVFRELALQGVNVLVVDRGDFCSGTSAASSRMVHGGIRYLENGEFRLVREAVQERNRLIENAPHYVKPLPTTIPIFNNFSGMLNAPLKFLGLLNKPSERGALVIKLGLLMYDSFTSGQQDAVGVPRHAFRRKAESLATYPALNPDVKYTATYYDAAMRDAERIAIEVMLDGLNAGAHAMALNYVSAAGADGDTVRLRDEESGETLDIRPKIVINAAGPWIDFVNQALGSPTRFVGGTKGSHIVVDYPELHDACDGAEFFFENEDGRIVLVYPLAGRVIIGTSDLKIENPDDVKVSDEEIDYFIKLANHVFPSLPVTRDRIVYSYVGVRPLPQSDANTTMQISRDHHNRIVEPELFEFPIFNLIGGKWTSFRAFSEQVANESLKRLRLPRTVETQNRPIGGGADYPSTAHAQTLYVENVALKRGVSESRVAALFDRYGTRADEFAAVIAAGEDRPLANLPSFSRREIEHIVRTEGVVHIEDFLQRRSLLALTGQVDAATLREIAEIIGGVLGWDKARVSAEIERTTAILQWHLAKI